MSDFIKCADFTKDGKTDWQAYRNAQIRSGERCCLCGEYLFFGGAGFPRLCQDCEDLDKPDELSHDHLVRCPKCGGYWEPIGSDEPELFGDGEHKVWCGDCGHTFEISTQVSFRFCSPAMEKCNDNEASASGESETLHD